MNAYWVKFSDGIKYFIDQHLINIILIIVVSYIVKKVIFLSLKIYIHHKVRGSGKRSKLKRRKTLVSVAKSATSIVTAVTAFILILQELNVNLTPFAASAGIFGAIIGFGSQSFIKDLVSGSFVIAEDQYRVGDWVTLNKIDGTVKEVSLRMTTLVDSSGITYYIPHNTVDVVANHSEGNDVINFNIAVKSGSNPKKVKELITKSCSQFSKIPEFKDTIIEKPGFEYISSVDGGSVTYKISGKVKRGSKYEATSKLKELILENLSDNSIELA